MNAAQRAEKRFRSRFDRSKRRGKGRRIRRIRKRGWEIQIRVRRHRFGKDAFGKFQRGEYVAAEYGLHFGEVELHVETLWIQDGGLSLGRA